MKRRLDQIQDEEPNVISFSNKKKRQIKSQLSSSTNVSEDQSSDAEGAANSSASSCRGSSDSEGSETEEASDDDEHSELSTSSSDDSSDEESDDGVDKTISVFPSKQPLIRSLEPSGLESRLSTFLPALAAANASMDRDQKAGKLSDQVIDADDRDEGQYIEMNLGLGVLEEQSRPNFTESTSPSSPSSVEDEPDAKGGARESSVMERLMGTRHSRPKIEEMNSD